MPDMLNTIVLGSLLHDIGKIMFRADNIRFVSHSKWGADFIEEENVEIPDRKQVAEIIRYHHIDALRGAKLSDSHPAYIVCEADNIASALDRRREDDREDKRREFNHHLALQSVFNLVGGERKGNLAYPALTLRPEDGIPFPREGCSLTPGDYAAWQRYLEENLKKINYRLESPNSVLKVMEAVASFIPSSTDLTEVPDISLFDHVKITAAVAASIYLYLEEKGERNYKAIFLNEEKRRQFLGEPAFMLVLADLSGIQDFIYTISSRGALKSLRARSFYLDLMCEHMADEILEELSLSRANLLYSGGGHFRLLLPNTRKAREAVEKARERFNRWLFKYYSTALYIEIASVPVSGNMLANQAGEEENTVRKSFEKLAYAANLGKLRRYQGSLVEEIFFSSPEIDAERECPICRTSSSRLANDPVNPESVICQNCLTLRNIGGRMGREKDSLLIAVTYESPLSGREDYLEIPSLKGEQAYLVFRKEEELKKEMEKGKLPVRIYSINRLYTGVNFATNLWNGNYSREPEKKEEGYIDFEELAQASQGIKRIGVLRADVDNLGSIFVEGLKQEGEADPYRFFTLSRLATMSRQLSLFFKYYINFICQRKGTFSSVYLSDERKENPHLAIVYAGGDDLFIVGAWNEVIDLALDIDGAFRRYTGERLSLSAGIGLFKPGFPISQMAYLTGELEKRAKEYRDSRGKEKNALALFGLDELHPEKDQVYSWEEFREGVLNEKYLFLKKVLHLEKTPLPAGKVPGSMSMLYRLLYLLSETDDDRGRINLARLVYVLARLEVPAGAGEQSRTALEELRRKIYAWATDSRHRKQLIMALNLLIYINRAEDN